MFLPAINAQHINNDKNTVTSAKKIDTGISQYPNGFSNAFIASGQQRRVCNSFSTGKVSVDSKWKQRNSAYLHHPDAGFIDKFVPTKGAVELFEKRTRNCKYYVDRDSSTKFYRVQSNGAIHYQKNGQWLTIDERLEQRSNKLYEASHQEEPVGFDADKQKSYIKSLQGTVYFNNWSLYGLINGKETLLVNANWENYTAGDEGFSVKDIFPGIDAEMKVGRGSVKTNFIIRQNRFSQYQTLIFKDKFEGSAGNGFIPTNCTNETDYQVGGQSALHLSPAIVYAENNAEGSLMNVSYSLTGNEVSLAVDKSYLDKYLPTGNVILDPLVSTTNSIAQTDISGSMDCGSITNACFYTLQVPSPAKTTITGVYFKFGFQTVGTALNKNGFWTITTGTCGKTVIFSANPDSAGYNTPGTTSTRGKFADITSFFGNCMPSPTCSSQNVPFTLGFYNNICGGTSTCSNNYIKAEEPFVVMLEGHTVEVDTITPATNICKGQKIRLTAKGKYGVPNYTYTWNNGAGTGSMVTVQPSSTTTYMVTITDQCGNTTTGSVPINVSSTPVPTISTAGSNSPVCEGSSIYLNASSATLGATYNWAGPASFISNIQNPTISNATLNDAGKYIVTCSANGCTSNPDTIAVTVNSKTASVSIQASTTIICPNNLVTFTATPTNGGISPNYQWKLNGTNVGANSDTYFSNTLNNGDKITCQMTSNSTCVSTAMVSSNSIAMSSTGTITVDTVPDITVCSGTTVDSIFFSGTGTSFSWTGSNSSIGLNSSGFNYTPPFTAINNGNLPVIDTITVTPYLGGGKAYIVNSSLNNVSVIDLTTNKTLKTISVGNSPRYVSISPNGERVYIANFYSNSISVINTLKDEVIKTILVDSKPSGIIVSPDSKRVYVSNYWTNSTTTTNNISIIDAETNTVIDKVAMPSELGPLAISPDGTKLYITNEGYISPSSDTNGKSVFVMNTLTNAIVATIQVGMSAHGLVVSPDGNYLYVANMGAQSISVVDTKTNKELRTISVGKLPTGITVTPDGQYLLVTNQLSNNVSVINTKTNNVTSTITTGTFPYGISTCSNGSYIYVTNSGSNTISIINIASLSLYSSITLVNSSTFGNFITGNPKKCDGTPRKFTITVKPKTKPTVAIKSSSAPICKGSTVSFSAVMNNAGNSVLYQWKKNGTVVSNDSVFLTALLNNNDTINCRIVSYGCNALPDTAEGKLVVKIIEPTTSTTDVKLYSSSLPYKWNGISCEAAGTYTAHFTNAAGCDSIATLIITINQLPIVNNIPDQTICNGSTVPSIVFSGTGTSYYWTCDNPSIGLSASGRDSISSFKVVNTGTTPVKSIVTMTPIIGNSYLYVSNSNTISVVNNATNKVVATIPVGTYPGNIAITPDGSKIYVPISSTNTVLVISTITNTIIAAIPVSNVPERIAITPNGSKVYVLSYISGTVSVIDTKTNTLTTTISVGKDPYWLAITPDGSRVYVSNSNSNSLVTVINTVTNLIIATISVQNYADWLSVSPDGSRIYVVSMNSNNPGFVSVINTATNTVVATIPVGNAPWELTISPDGKRVYVPNYNSGTVSIINTVTNKVIATIKNLGGVKRIKVSPDGSKIYVLDFATSVVSVINTITNSIIATIPVGGSPENLLINSDGSRVYVTNSGTNTASGANTVSVINTDNNAIVATIPVGSYPNFLSISENNNTGSSKSFTITVNPSVNSSVQINATASSICPNNTVTFKSIPTNGGTSPIYLWKLNNSKVGANSNTYITDSLNNNDTISCIMTSNASCSSPATITSNKIIMTVKKATSSITNGSICPGNSYRFSGKNYTVAGIYTAQLTNAAGCDSTATLVLKVLQPTSSITNAGICQGNSYRFNGKDYTTEGTYTVHLTNATGCDSTATLVLKVSQPTSSIINASICQGNSYRFNGKDYSVAGTYTVRQTNAGGCDSTATLVLRVTQPTSSTTNENICQGNSYRFNGKDYTTAGTYTIRLTNVASCDSTATLILSVWPTSSITQASICQGNSYQFNGENYTLGGTYTVHLTNAGGCDSTATLVLKIAQPTSSTVYANICQGNNYRFNGNVYTKAGTYTAHLTNASGCDSIITLQLKEGQPSSSRINTTICQGDSYSINGESFTTAGTYTMHVINASGCDSTITLGLEVKPTSNSTTIVSITKGDNYTFNKTIYSNAGTYEAHLTNVAGCDSICTLILNVDEAVITIPEFFTPNGDGFNDRWEIGKIDVYPDADIYIFDRFGKPLAHYKGNDKGWDGIYKGVPMPTNDYWYKVDLHHNIKPFLGHVSLIR